MHWLGPEPDNAAWIVLHTTVCNLKSAENTFLTPNKVSAHYLIDTDGTIVQMVDEKDAAWADGNYFYNLNSIAIERVDNGDYMNPRITEEQHFAEAWLIKDIADRYLIPINRTYIIGHKEVPGSATACPDGLAIDQLVADAAAGNGRLPAAAPNPDPGYQFGATPVTPGTWAWRWTAAFVAAHPDRPSTDQYGPTPTDGPAYSWEWKLVGVPIMDVRVATAAQMRSVLTAAKIDPDQVVAAYILNGKDEGVSADGAFAQMCHETGFLVFGGDVQPSQNNFCGLGATGGVPGLSFATIDEGVRAHLRHLRAYATTDPLPADTPTVDPRGVPAHLRGSAPTFHLLGGKWAPAADYGDHVEATLAQIRAIATPAPTPEPTPIPAPTVAVVTGVSVPGIVFDTATNDRSWVDYASVQFVPGQIADIGLPVVWSEAKLVGEKWLLHITPGSWGLWDDCVDDTDATHDAAHSSPPDFVNVPVPAPVPVPPPAPVPVPVPVPTPPDLPSPPPGVLDWLAKLLAWLVKLFGVK